MSTLISITLCMLLECDVRTTIQQCFHLSGLSHPSWFNFEFNPVLMKQVIYLCLVLSLCLSNLAAQAQSISLIPAFQAEGNFTDIGVSVVFYVEAIYVPLFQIMP